MFISAMAVTLGCLKFIDKEQKAFDLNEFKLIAENQTVMLKSMIYNDLRNIGAAANFYQSSTVENYPKFPVFAKTLIENSESLIALEWMQKVARENIDTHVQEMNTKFGDFQLYTIPRGKPKRQGYIFQDNRPIYVVSDIYPRAKSSQPLLGFYSSRKRFELILDDITTSGKPNLSDPVRLIQDGLEPDTPKEGLLVYYPVYDSDKTSLKGIMIGVIRMTEYFDDLVFKTISDHEFLIKISDTGFGSEDVSVMFESPSWQQFEGTTILKRIPLQNRIWNVEFKIEHLLTDVDRATQFYFFLAGSFISLLLSVVVYIVQNQKHRLAEQLAERTKELQYMVDHDSLTDLYNRRAFNHRLDARIEKQQPFSLILFDVDNFKCINDNYGHPAGDAVLKHLARSMELNTEGNNDIFRLGGDEFCILSAITTEWELEQYVSSLQNQIKIKPLEFNGIKINYTLSIGVNIWRKQLAEEFLQYVDKALYQSKQNGRDRITLCS